MGQHKYNPTAIAAKKGELPPKPRKPGKREREAMLMEAMKKALRKSGLPTPDELQTALGIRPYE